MDDIADGLYANKRIDWGPMGLNQKLEELMDEMYDARKGNPDTIFCEQCGGPIEPGDPGHWWKVNSSKYPEPVTPALHDRECRREWFLEQPIIRWYIKDAEIAWRSK